MTLKLSFCIYTMTDKARITSKIYFITIVIFLNLFSFLSFYTIYTTSVGGNVKIFDSLNLSPSSDLMKQIRVLYSPDITITPTVLKAELRSIQSGSKDCGLFAVAYAVEIAYGNDPAKFIFKQSAMRQHLHNCLTSKSMSAFPKVRELHTDSVFKDITSDYQSEK